MISGLLAGTKGRITLTLAPRHVSPVLGPALTVHAKVGRSGNGDRRTTNMKGPDASGMLHPPPLPALSSICHIASTLYERKRLLGRVKDTRVSPDIRLPYISIAPQPEAYSCTHTAAAPPQDPRNAKSKAPLASGQSHSDAVAELN